MAGVAGLAPSGPGAGRPDVGHDRAERQPLRQPGHDPAGAGDLRLAAPHRVEEVTSAIEVVDLAMETLGGRAYFRRSPLERDVRAGTFHPFTPEATLAYAGKLALGDPGTTE